MKNYKKISIGAFLIIVVALFAWTIKPYFSAEYKEQREQERIWKEYNEQFENDTMGGSTPEETLELFISALEKGDLELASKYFIADKQEESLEYINGVNDNNNLKLFINELKLPYTKYDFANSGTNFILDIYNKEDDTHINFDVAQNSNGVWKILDL